jgi:hypothetical protein
VAPRDRRSDWIEEWRSELWYVPPYHATRFCMGAFQDALWLRRNNRERRDSAYLDSAASCLASLAALAALSLLISAACLLGPLHSTTSYWRLTPGDLPGACVLMLAYTGVLLPITALAMRRAGFSSPNPGRLRRALFFIVKTALVQPIMLCAFFVSLLLGPVAPLASQLGMLAMWILACRWLIADQRRRCPVCLRLLTQTVRIGTASQTFLEWYGAESLCSRGHGLLHLPETQTTYNAGPQWLRLGDSWSGVFGR